MKIYYFQREVTRKFFLLDRLSLLTLYQSTVFVKIIHRKNYPFCEKKIR